MRTTTILTKQQLRDLVTLDLEAIRRVGSVFRTVETKKVVMPPILFLYISEHRGEVDVKPAYIPDLDGFAIKISPGPSSFPALGQLAAGVIAGRTPDSQITVADLTGAGNQDIPPLPIEADIRVPLGVEKDTIVNEMCQIVARYPGVTFDEVHFTPPAFCDPYGEMSELLRQNVNQLSGVSTTPIVSLACTEARLWRYRNVPAYIYGPPPVGIASHDEHVSIDDYLHVVRAHVLSAYDYLSIDEGPSSWFGSIPTANLHPSGTR